MLAGINPSKAANAFDRSLFKSVAGEGITGIGRENHDRPVLQLAHEALEQQGIVVFSVKFLYHDILRL